MPILLLAVYRLTGDFLFTLARTTLAKSDPPMLNYVVLLRLPRLKTSLTGVGMTWVLTYYGLVSKKPTIYLLAFLPAAEEGVVDL